MQWREATVGRQDATGFEAYSSGRRAGARRQAGIRRDRGRLLSVASQLAVAGPATALPVGLDLPCTEDPELFFAESPQDVEQAKAMCRAAGPGWPA